MNIVPSIVPEATLDAVRRFDESLAWARAAIELFPPIPKPEHKETVEEIAQRLGESIAEILAASQEWPDDSDATQKQDRMGFRQG